MSILSGFFTESHGQFNPLTGITPAEYIFNSGYVFQGTDGLYVAQWTYNALYVAVTTFPSYIILLNTIIPISLVVTLEVVKTL